MSEHQYYDSNIFMRSRNLILKVAYYYYYKNMRQREIADILDISIPTISRLLNKAKEMGIVKMTIDDRYLDCLGLEESILEKYQLRNVVVAPVPEGYCSKEELKRTVALEGARYLQRTITDRDVLGVAYGETVWYVYNFLNPSQKKNLAFVTLHGMLYREDNKLDGSWLVPRIAKVFGGSSYQIDSLGFQKSEQAAKEKSGEAENKKVFEQFKNVTISVSGVGMMYPEQTTALIKNNYFSDDELKELTNAGAYGDIVFRFFDRNGAECETSLKNRTVGISLDEYRRIPNKIVIASGEKKWQTLSALLKGRLVDTLIIDQNLAEKLTAEL